MQYFMDFGYQSNGLDINQPMLDIAKIRCREAQFSLQEMSTFISTEPVDLITCFLYSIHYNADIGKLKRCIERVHHALIAGGIFCFNAVGKNKLDNTLFAKHSVQQADEILTLSSGWNYPGDGANQSLKVSIEKTTATDTQQWYDEHPMVAFSFVALLELLRPNFVVHVFEHDHEKIIPWNTTSGNAIFTCIKI